MRFTIHTIRFDTIDSTHSWAKNNFSTLDLNGLTCITALEQTAGCGRHKRKWITAPPGLNIHATLCFTLPIKSPFVVNLAQLLSLSAVSVLEKCGFSPEIKWPNDIRVQGKKIAGILCETSILSDVIAVILSIGLNGNVGEAFLKKIDQPATSLAQLSGHPWNLDEILNNLLMQFLSDLETLLLRGFSPFRERYQHLLAFKGEKIRCFDGEKHIEGICQGILPDGRLELALDNGEKVFLFTGDVLKVEKMPE